MSEANSITTCQVRGSKTMSQSACFSKKKHENLSRILLLLSSYYSRPSQVKLIADGIWCISA